MCPLGLFLLTLRLLPSSGQVHGSFVDVFVVVVAGVVGVVRIDDAKRRLLIHRWVQVVPHDERVLVAVGCVVAATRIIGSVDIGDVVVGR